MLPIENLRNPTVSVVKKIYSKKILQNTVSYLHFKNLIFRTPIRSLVFTVQRLLQQS